jgi:hypothetical protein
MSETVTLQKQVLQANSYNKVVNTEFVEFKVPTIPVQEAVTVEQFFQYYEELFYEIPVTGETNSHEYLVKRSSEYIAGDIISDNEKALLEEINSLRQQLLEANKNLVDISKIV